MSNKIATWIARVGCFWIVLAILFLLVLLCGILNPFWWLGGT